MVGYSLSGCGIFVYFRKDIVFIGMSDRAEILKANEEHTDRLPPYLRSGLLLVALLAVSVALAILIIKLGWVVGFVFLAIIIGLPLVWVSFNNPLHALIVAIVLSYLIFVVRRLSGQYEMPTGLAADAIIVIGALGVLFNKRRTEQPIKNVITISFFITVAYVFLEVANPNAYNISAWLNLGLRSVIVKICVFVLSLHAFTSKESVKTFTITCLSLAFVAALYGIYQEWAGLPQFELRWVMADPVRYKLFFINGEFRKWSILGEVSSFGVIMAYSAITALILTLGPFRFRYKVLLFIASVCMMMGMAYSGTRTAFVMLPVGIMFYVLLTIKTRRSIIFTVFAVTVGLVLFFGPFYGPTFSRIRTAFKPSEDASMQVREENRDMIQPYMWTHPFGGGIGTTSVAGTKYHPGHFLAGFPPDSGYMLTVLETGYIGLLISIWLYFITMAVGVKNYFRTRDPSIKIYYVAYMAAFFAITFGNIAQNAVAYPPADIINVCIMVLMFRLIFFDTKPTSTVNETI